MKEEGIGLSLSHYSWIPLTNGIRKCVLLPYIPLEGGNYLLTSNRDEAPARFSQNITRQRIAGQELVLFPATKPPEERGSLSPAPTALLASSTAHSKTRSKPALPAQPGLMALDF